MRKVDDRTRRRLLQGAVDENLDVIDDRPLGTNRRGRERRRRRRRKAATVVASACVGLAAVVAVARLGTGSEPAAPEIIPALAIPAAPPAADAAGLTDLLAARAPGAEIIALGVQRVVVDPGHGGMDGGTSLEFGLLEKDLTLDISRRLADGLDAAGLDVILTRDTDEAVSLRDRAQTANESRADLFLSIHVNWLPDRSARGMEIYYLGATDDPFLNRLAASENRDSGYTLADYRALLDRIWADARRTESHRLAQTLQANLFSTVQAEHEALLSRGVMTAPFVVLVATDMPAVLVEVACISNEREARLLALPRYRQRIADALVRGVIGYAAATDRSHSGTHEGETS